MPLKEPSVLTIPKRRRHVILCRSTWGRTLVGQEAEGTTKVARALLPGKEWTGEASLSTFRTGQFKLFQQALGYRGGVQVPGTQSWGDLRQGSIDQAHER